MTRLFAQLPSASLFGACLLVAAFSALFSACAVTEDRDATEMVDPELGDSNDDATKGDSKETCEPADERVCECRDRSKSVQECDHDGEWGLCDCNEDEWGDTGDDDDASQTGSDAPASERTSVVYVNTKESLYYVDPFQSNELIFIGNFNGPCTQGSGFYDIAVDEYETIVGIAAEGLYTIDRKTAECQKLVLFSEDAPHFFSLSYVKGVDPDQPERDVLMAASAEDGQWVEIDYVSTMGDVQFVPLGYHVPGAHTLVSSGDIVSLRQGDGSQKTYATLKCSNGYSGDGCENDWLAEIVPETGEAHLIGQTGFKQIFGLAFWGDKVYGFTNNNEYVLINTTTGKGELVTRYQTKKFWGAGSVTIPYVIVE